MRELKIAYGGNRAAKIWSNKLITFDALCALMAEAPAWADGLPLRADGYECEFYKKD